MSFIYANTHDQCVVKIGRFLTEEYDNERKKYKLIFSNRLKRSVFYSDESFDTISLFLFTHNMFFKWISSDYIFDFEKREIIKIPISKQKIMFDQDTRRLKIVEMESEKFCLYCNEELEKDIDGCCQLCGYKKGELI